MTPDVTVLRDVDAPDAPGDDAFQSWVAAAAGGRVFGLAIRLVDEAESRRLNQAYRGKERPTNVLSFPSDLPASVAQALDPPPLGDLALCAPLVAEEAREQGKAPHHHWAHLTIHGVLHLLGHDHEEEAQAQAMEALEIRLLAGLGIPDPYALPG